MLAACYADRPSVAAKRMRTFALAFLIAFSLLAGCGPAGDAPQADSATAPVEQAAPADAIPPVSIAGSFRHVVRSEAIGQDFLIDVVVPPAGEDEKLPVVYVTDGNLNTPLMASAGRWMQFGGELPAVIIVGIGYPTSEAAEIVALRMRELTPTATTFPGSEAPSGGGAAAFLDFIEQDLKPFIEASYAADPNDSTLAGFSLGGLFTLYGLFNRTDDYQRYIAGSPSIWWDDAMLFGEEAAYAERATELDVDLFMSVGSLEESGPASTAKMVTNVQRMAEVLRERGYPNLRLSDYIFEQETHLSVIPATLSRGLREVFADDVAAMRAAAAAAAAAETNEE